MKTDKKQINIILDNGHVVHPDFLNRIRYAIKERLPLLPPTMKWPLKDIFDRKAWGRMSPGEQKEAGSCMKHLVATGEFPQLRVADTRHEYPIHYQFK